jgi:hypothetical protein
MKTSSIRHQLTCIGIGVMAAFTLSPAHAQYDWGTWIQDTSTTLHNSNPNYGTATLTVSGNYFPSANVPTADIYYPILFPNDTFVAAGGAYSQMNISPSFTNTFQVDIDLTGYNTSQGNVLFGLSDVASIGYVSTRVYYRLQAFNSSWQTLNVDSALVVGGNDINQWWPTEDAEFTVNATTGVLDFLNPQAGRDSQGYFFAIDSGVAHIRFQALSTTGGDGMRFYIGTPEIVPEPGTLTLLGLGVTGLIACCQRRKGA